MRICWMARRVSASMSRRVCSIISSRLARASAMVSFSAASAVRRARATISSAWPRASESRSRYSARSWSASLRVFSAASMESSIARWRFSSASAMRGNATFQRKKRVSPNTTSVQIISPTSGVTRKLPPDSSAAISGFIALLQEEGDQARHQAVEEAGLGKGETQPLDGRDLVAHLRLAGDGLDHLAEDDADADAGADGAEAATNTEGDRLAGVLAVFSGSEDEGQERAQQVNHGWSLLVGLGDRAADVDRGQSGEDERLQSGHEAHLEQVQHDAQGQQQNADPSDAEDDRQAPGHEQDDQVAGEHVGEESDAERDDAHQVRHQLQHEDEPGHRAGHPRWDEALEVPAQTLGAN